MEIKLTKISYELTEDGVTTDIPVELGGNDSNGQYASARLIIKAEDLDAGKTLDDLTKADIVAIAKAKLVKEVTPVATTTTTTAAQ